MSHNAAGRDEKDSNVHDSVHDAVALYPIKYGFNYLGF